MRFEKFFLFLSLLLFWLKMVKERERGNYQIWWDMRSFEAEKGESYRLYVFIFQIEELRREKLSAGRGGSDPRDKSRPRSRPWRGAIRNSRHKLTTPWRVGILSGAIKIGRGGSHRWWKLLLLPGSKLSDENERIAPFMNLNMKNKYFIFHLNFFNRTDGNSWSSFFFTVMPQLPVVWKAETFGVEW